MKLIFFFYIFNSLETFNSLFTDALLQVLFVVYTIRVSFVLGCEDTGLFPLLCIYRKTPET